MQNIVWLGDQDEIASDEKHLRDLTQLFGLVASAVVPHDLGHLRCGTTASDPGDLSLEDLAAIPDLAAGAVRESFEAYLRSGVTPTRQLIVPTPGDLDWRAGTIMNWLSDDRTALRHTVFRFEPTDRGGLSITHFRLHGTGSRAI